MNLTLSEIKIILNVLTSYSGYNGNDAFVIVPIMQKLKNSIQNTSEEGGDQDVQITKPKSEENSSHDQAKSS